MPDVANQVSREHRGLLHGDEDAAGIATKGLTGELAEAREHRPGAGR
jgi:hypothetical protein